MKRFVILLMVIPFMGIYSQRIGEMAEPKPPIVFPNNSWGMDIMFGEGGLGLGTFYRKNITNILTGFIDLSFSEVKDEREVEYIDFFGRPFTVGKENRIFLVPINFGLQYRLFRESIDDNLRPYINIGAGPAWVMTTPYEKEYFSAFGDAVSRFTVGGYVGFGANIGINKNNLVGINVRYYHVQFFDDGVEGLKDRFKKVLGGFYLTINLGIMY